MKVLPVLLMAAMCSVSPCVAQEPAPPAAPAVPARPVVEATNVTPDEAEKLIAETPGLIILDVRTPEEFDHGHIKGAVNANLFDDGFENQVAALDPAKPVLIHCQSGRRSSQALVELAGKLKAPKVYHLSTGFAGWKNAKKPIEEKPLPGAGRVGPPKKPAAKPAK